MIPLQFPPWILLGVTLRATNIWENFSKTYPITHTHISNYCRRDTLKLYLEFSFQTMSQLNNRVYKELFCLENDLTPLVSRNLFVKIF